MNGSGIECGFAEVDFTPRPGLTLMGQMHERRGEYTRDPLSASALAVRSGDETVVVVSVDICFLDAGFVSAAQAAFAERTGLPRECLLLHSTHTHVAPTTTTLLEAVAEPSFVERLLLAIVSAARSAVARLCPADLFHGIGHLIHMGWNRRAIFSDGTSRMYGHSEMSGFAGMEGPRDPALGVLWFRDDAGRIPGIVINFATHPNTLENESFYSADIPGEVRRTVRRLLGPDTGVVYLTGAAGNTAPSILDPHRPDQPWRGDAGLRRSGLYLGGEVARVVAAGIDPDPSFVLRHASTTLSVPLRPWPEPGDPQYSGWDVPYYERAASEWPDRLARLSPMAVPLHVIRLGGAAICTNPAELFVEYGLAIRDRSPAATTLIAELTDGYVGYVPTRRAFDRGGYETWTAPSSQLAPEAGDRIVEATAGLLAEAFAE